MRIVLTFLLILPFLCKGQEEVNRQKVRFSASFETIISTDSIKPFWTRVNKNGTVPLKGDMYAIDLRMNKEYDSLFTKNRNLNNWGIAYGARAFGGINGEQPIFFLPEAYVKVRWKHFEFYGGRRQEVFGLVDTLASSGSYIWSGNAMPLPKLQLHTPGFLPITKRGFLSMKAGMSHGWFSDNGVVKNHWLHQKWLYGKIGRSDSKVQFSAGVNHQVMWGGYSEILKEVGGQFPPTVDGFLTPNPLYSYPYIILPFLHKIKPQSPDKVSAYDAGNVVGNQLGSVDMAFDIHFNRVKVLLYMQQPFDFARSLVLLNNIEDGLYGLSITLPSPAIHHLCFEFFDSRSHGRYRFGEYRASNRGEVDNYFFHGQYQSWSNQGNILGNPFIIDQYLEGSQLRFNNRLSYIYTNASGSIRDINYQLKIVRSRNLGTFGREIDLIQNSYFISLNKQFGRNFSANLDLSIDRGYLYPQNESLGLRLNYTL